MRLPRFVAVAVILAGSLAIAQEPADFDPESNAWNGASLFVAEARATGLRVTAPRTVSLDDLHAHDVVILLGPGRPLPEGDLVEFVRRGGQLVIADDFGTAGPLLGRFGIRRTEAGATAAPRVRGHDELLVGRPFYAHPLTEGISVVVTNRPALLEHPRLVPLLGLDEGGGALVLTGVVGEGRVVAISDPSLFVDEMMVLRGNRRLATNVLGFVTQAGARSIVIAAGDARFEGSYDGPMDGTLRERIQSVLASLAEVRLPDHALRIAALTLAALVLVLFATLRVRRDEPALPWLLPGERPAKRSASAAESLVELVHVAVERRLSLRPDASRSERDRAVRALGLSPSEERRMLAALADLGSHASGPTDPSEARRLASVWNGWLDGRSARNRMKTR